MPSRALTVCHPELVLRWKRVVDRFYKAQTSRKILVTCTYRPVEEQQALYAQGRTKPGPVVTQLDGVKHRSNHNMLPCRALDFAVLVYGKVSWDVVEYMEVGALVLVGSGLVWGGNWPHFKDYPHVELPQEVA